MLASGPNGIVTNRGGVLDLLKSGALVSGPSWLRVPMVSTPFPSPRKKSKAEKLWGL